MTQLPSASGEGETNPAIQRSQPLVLPEVLVVKMIMTSE